MSIQFEHAQTKYMYIYFIINSCIQKLLLSLSGITASLQIVSLLKKRKNYNKDHSRQLGVLAVLSLFNRPHI